MAGTVQCFESIGLPRRAAGATVIAETVGGAPRVLGIGSCYFAAALALILPGTLWGDAGNGWGFSAPEGGWAYALSLIVFSGVQTLVGQGAHALGSRRETAPVKLQAAKRSSAVGRTVNGCLAPIERP